MVPKIEFSKVKPNLYLKNKYIWKNNIHQANEKWSWISLTETTGFDIISFILLINDTERLVFGILKTSFINLNMFSLKLYVVLIIYWGNNICISIFPGSNFIKSKE